MSGRRAPVVEDDAPDDVRAAVAEEPGVGHLDAGGPACIAVQYGLDPLGDAPRVAVPVAPAPLEVRDVEDAVDQRGEVRAGRDREIEPYCGGAFARGLRVVQECVLHRLPHAFVHHPPRGVDVGEGEVRFVAPFDQGEVAGLEPRPERLVIGDRGQHLAQPSRERVHTDAVHGEPPQAQLQRSRGVAPLEGGLREVGDVARLDVVGVELRQDPARGQIQALVHRVRRRDAARIPCGPAVVHGAGGRSGREGRHVRRRTRPAPGRQSSWCIRVLRMTTASCGTSWNMPREPVSTAAIRSTVSMPSTTRPKAV